MSKKSQQKKSKQLSLLMDEPHYLEYSATRDIKSTASIGVTETTASNIFSTSPAGTGQVIPFPRKQTAMTPFRKRVLENLLRNRIYAD